MAQVAKDRPGGFQAVANGAKELSALKAGFAAGYESRFSHGNSRRGEMLLLF